MKLSTILLKNQKITKNFCMGAKKSRANSSSTMSILYSQSSELVIFWVEKASFRDSSDRRRLTNHNSSTQDYRQSYQ